MPTRLRPPVVGTIPVLMFVFCLLVLGAGTAAAAPTVCWVETTVAPEALPSSTEVYYDGLAVRLIGVGSEDLVAVLELGGRAIALDVEEELYVALVEDADRAEFLPPTRIITRVGHEVVLAMRGGVPQFTQISEQNLRGLREFVRVDQTPRVMRTDASPPQAPREADPLISDMVGGLTEASYTATWQILDDFENRYYAAPENEVASQWMLDEFAAMGLDAEFHFYEQSGTRRNVVATLPGLVDPTQVVYICGHFDAISGTPDICAPGADDNGSGTANVIEAARVLSQYSFWYTIKFACFNGEEQGLVGSAAYVSDIAAAGEDVIACYNVDMIGYRGTDPAPPDLVIYTNNNSVSLATTLETACTDYLPGLLQPIVIVEALAASDHASFWNHGYRAIGAIEDEAWGDDFCPWYHTCEDRIERYPTDYATYCAKANLAAVATTAIPLNPDGSFLTLESTQIDDDMLGESNGNGDGDPNPGEVIELWVTLENLGQQSATNVSGVLSVTGTGATILEDSASWNDIPSSGLGTNLAPFVFEVAGTALDQEELAFLLTVTDDLGVREISIPLSVVAPSLTYRSHNLDDATHGNGNGIPEPGEVLVLSVSLSNGGGQDAADVEAVLSSSHPHVAVIDALGTNDAIGIGLPGLLDPPFRIAIQSDAVDGDLLPLDLAISANAGYTANSGFTIRVGSSFYDDVESDAGWSLSAAGDDASNGRWVRVDPNGTYQDGSIPCQPEDDHTPDPGTTCFVTGQGSEGGTIGEADVDGGKTTLTTPLLDLTTVVDSRINYWRWYTNDLGNSPGEDTWLVQISSNGGASWVDLENTTSSENSWQQMSFLASDYITPTDQVVVRFVASDEINGSLVEAAVDDFQVTGESQTVDAAELPEALTLRLDPARPNPAAAGSRLSFSVPREGHLSLRIYAIDGRMVRELLDRSLPAGHHQVVWDGRAENGRPAADGVYFAKLRLDGRELTRRVNLLK